MVSGLKMRKTPIYAMFPDLGFDLKWLLAAASMVPTITEMT